MRFVSVLFAVFLAVAAIWWLGRDLIPPKSLTFAAGPEGGGYAALARRYSAILARDGIDVEIVETAGSAENARLIGEGGADVVLLQGGITAPEGTEALGAMFYEPMFVFVRSDAPIAENPGVWQGLALAAGGEGSGTRVAVRSFLSASGVAGGANTLLPMGGADGAAALIAGTADAAFFVAPLNTPYLRPLFDDPDILLVRLRYLGALSRRIEHAERVTLSAGAVSLDPPRPTQPTELLAMIARLVAREDLHPSLVDRLVMAAREIHGRRDQITDEAQFPTTNGVTMPLDAYARDLINAGPSPLLAYLPYWVVAQINRFAILLLPIIFLLLPLLRSLPGLYQWRMRAQVYQYYREIREIDTEAADTTDPAHIAALRERLDGIDRHLSALQLPLAYRHFAYNARLHIDLVRDKLQRRKLE